MTIGACAKTRGAATARAAAARAVGGVVVSVTDGSPVFANEETGAPIFLRDRRGDMLVIRSRTSAGAPSQARASMLQWPHPRRRAVPDPRRHGPVRPPTRLDRPHRAARATSSPPRRWPALAATLDRDDPAPRGRAAALPPLWHWLYFLPLAPQSETRPRRPPAARRLPAAGAAAAPHVGRRAARVPRSRCASATRSRATSRIADVDAKAGRSGALVFVTVRHEIATPAGVALTRGARHRLPRAAARPAHRRRRRRRRRTDEAFARAIVPDPVLLFRYSALTFNGHRIHYDRRYVTEVEGYPGLIVHGPLIATLLVDLLRRERPDASVRALRASRPCARCSTCTRSRVCGRPDGDGSVALWARNHEGALAMQAQRRARLTTATTNRMLKTAPDRYQDIRDAVRALCAAVPRRVPPQDRRAARLSRGLRRRADQGRLAGRADPAGIRRLRPGPDRGVGDHGGDQPLAAATPAPATARCTTWARCCATAPTAQKERYLPQDRQRRAAPAVDGRDRADHRHRHDARSRPPP